MANDVTAQTVDTDKQIEVSFTVTTEYTYIVIPSPGTDVDDLADSIREGSYDLSEWAESSTGNVVADDDTGKRLVVVGQYVAYESNPSDWQVDSVDVEEGQ
jgi:hypothetical protein